MAAAAVSCSLVSRGCCLNNQAVSAQSAVVGGSSIGSKSFVWDPLHRRHALLRSSRSAYLSSSSAPSTSFAFSRDITETRRKTSGLNLAAPRASSGDEEESEHMTEITEIESEDGLNSNVEKSPETSQSVWSRILASSAKPAVVAVMMALLLAQPVEDAFAASSGGRMGGKAFSSPRPSAPSRSYSGGGGGGGGGGRAYSGGGGGVYVAPPLYGSPYGFSPFGYSPFYGGGYGGGFLGPSIGFGGGGTIILAMIAFATLRAVLGLVRDRFRGDEEDRFDD